MLSQSIDTVLIFVHIGTGRAPLLLSMATDAACRLPKCQVVLVTDDCRRWVDFPGMVIQYTRGADEEWLSSLVRRYPEKGLEHEGYWIRTLERLFALRTAIENFPESEFVHIESDVFSLIDSDVLDALRSTHSRPAAPRLSPGLVCPSIIYIPTAQSGQQFLARLSTYMRTTKLWHSDMELLDVASKRGWLEELPTTPIQAAAQQISSELSDDRSRSARRLAIFDALAIGQYLFGQDPFHTAGLRKPGHIWPDFPGRIAEWAWAVSPPNQDGNVTILVDDGALVAQVANVHLQSKFDPGLLISPVPETWVAAIQEANGVIASTPQFIDPGNYSRKAAPLWARIAMYRHQPLRRAASSLRYRGSRVARFWKRRT